MKKIILFSSLVTLLLSVSCKKEEINTEDIKTGKFVYFEQEISNVGGISGDGRAVFIDAEDNHYYFRKNSVPLKFRKPNDTINVEIAYEVEDLIIQAIYLQAYEIKYIKKL
ncbi:MAG: hypothetical protein PHW92_12910 [Lutibacter sp.]|jgi:hypothetical protein|nr:hypothetical protein [Lutibacter sp.]MDD3723359.1 hypothetical protein [Lutibacter sp.]